MKILERIREIHRESRLNGIEPEYFIMKRTDYEELVDYLIENSLVNTMLCADTPKVLGMKIILDERKILRLPIEKT